MAAPILLCYIDVSTLYYLYLSAVVGNNKVYENISVNYYSALYKFSLCI